MSSKGQSKKKNWHTLYCASGLNLTFDHHLVDSFTVTSMTLKTSDQRQNPNLAQFRGNDYHEAVTCRLVRGSIFMTGPTVLRGRATSMLWFGPTGVRTWSGPAGARPKLQRNT